MTHLTLGTRLSCLTPAAHRHRSPEGQAVDWAVNELRKRLQMTLHLCFYFQDKTEVRHEIHSRLMETF